MKPQALEGDGKLGAPAMLGAVRSHEPDGIPLFTDLAVFDDEGIDERSQRVGGEVESIMPVAEAVDQNLYAIVCGQVGVTRHLRADDTLRVRVEAHDPDVEILVVIKQFDFCSLACFCALMWLALTYLPDRCRRFPIRFV